MKSMKSLLIPASAAALFVLAGSAPAVAESAPIDVESVQVDIDHHKLTVAGVGLEDVDEVTITNGAGEEIVTAFNVQLSRNQPATLGVKLNSEPGTYRLRVYSGGAFKDQLDVTVPASSARAVRADAVVHAEGTETCSVSKCSVTVTCPSGYRVVGGGYWQHFYYDVYVRASYPESIDTWRVDVERVNPKGHWTDARAYATCLRVENPKQKFDWGLGDLGLR